MTLLGEYYNKFFRAGLCGGLGPPGGLLRGLFGCLGASGSDGHDV